MIHDDRLETVLRTPAAGAGASRIRFAQLLDILGRVASRDWNGAHDIALARLVELGAGLPADAKRRLLETAPLRSVPVVRALSGEEAGSAALAMAGARLTEDEWLGLIPELPVRARGFLRRRQDLGPRVERLLHDLGANDLALPLPADYVEEAPAIAAGAPAPVPMQPLRSDPNGIGAIVRRIEAFRRARDEAVETLAIDPRLPFAEDRLEPSPRIAELAFRTDAEGAIDWADGAAQTALWGHHPFTAGPDAPLRCDATTVRQVRSRVPVQGGRLEIEGPEHLAGAWQVDAIPLFADRGGRFTGYIGRFRRTAKDVAARPANDQLRQLLHELRTPINAVQGFAELIQQQIFGPTPHEYRGLAAAIAADAARILGGFEDIDRLIKLETAQVDPDAGSADIGDAFRRMVAQLETVVAPREVRLKVDLPAEPLLVGIEAIELERMLWRALAVIGSAAQPGERLRFSLARDGDSCLVSMKLPASLADLDDDRLFAPDSKSAPLPGSAMLGSGFALRLAAAEARGARGRLVRHGEYLRLHLPLLPEQFGNHNNAKSSAAGGTAGPN